MNILSADPCERGPKIQLLERVSTKIRTLLRARKYRNSFEARELEALFEFMPKGGCAIDVGAYKGAWTYWMEHIAGRQGRVIAFEPQPDASAQLKKIQTIMHWPQVRIEPYGVGNTNGILPLYREIGANTPSQGAHFMSKQNHMKCLGHVTVTRLDDYKIKNQIPRIHFIKIDAEGFERKVIDGARDILMQDRPVIVIECDANFIGSSEQQLFFNEMKELGYEGYFFTETGRENIAHFDCTKHQKTNLPKGLSDPLYYNNFLFIPHK